MNDSPVEKLLLSRQEFEAKVISVTDPEKLLRVQVMVMGLFDGVQESDLPWATYKLPIGSNVNHGDFTPVNIGDIVWVDFPFMTMGRKDTRRPRITGSVHFAPDNLLNMPHEVFDGVESMTADNGYHKAKTLTFYGNTVEFLPNEVYRVTNRNSGSNIEMLPNGDIRILCKGTLYETISGDKITSVGGDEITVVSGVMRDTATEIHHN